VQIARFSRENPKSAAELRLANRREWAYSVLVGGGGQ
jgi:hypothetical protein